MSHFLILSVFCSGAILGSFLNVLVLRLGTGVSYLSGRSKCPSCGSTLSFLELIPIFSYLIQRGRCHSCSVRISPQYIVVETLMGILVLGSFFFAGALDLVSPGTFIRALFYSALCFLALGIAVYDIRHKIIPDLLLYIFLFLSFLVPVSTFLSGGLGLPELGLALVTGPLLFMPFFLIWYFSDGRLMGLGDGFLSIGTGWLLGPSLSVSAVIFGIWFGAIWGVTWILLGRVYTFLGLSSFRETLTMKSEVPLAPFLLLGLIFVAVSGVNLFYAPFPNF
ncbi:MAG: prepilin peptidase [Patescibacteria group bacterium]